jgi:hypothetical protein
VLVKKIRNKLNEYGLTILSDYKLQEGENEYVFIIKEVVIFIREKEKSIGLSFQATTKPERAATLTLIISELRKCTIFVMESFIFDGDHKFISGDNAYKLIKDTAIEVAKNEITKEQMYNRILQCSKGFEC